MKTLLHPSLAPLMLRHTMDRITSDCVFVFGSNQAGIHGAGAAAHAREYWGAVMGIGEGRTGQSYALPTKNQFILSMKLKDIDDAVLRFLNYTYKHPELHFQVTRVGCGLAGFTDAQIAPMFNGAPKNCHMPFAWKGLIK